MNKFLSLVSEIVSEGTDYKSVYLHFFPEFFDQCSFKFYEQ